MFLDQKETDTMKDTQFQLRNTHDSNNLGAMPRNGSAGLYFLPPGMTIIGKKYSELFKDKLKIHMDIHHCRIFMHRPPCHRELYLIF